MDIIDRLFKAKQKIENNELKSLEDDPVDNLLEYQRKAPFHGRGNLS